MVKNYFKITCILFFSGLAVAVFSQNVGINTSGSTPSTNAILDLNTGNTSYNLGFILPHVELGASLTTFGMANAVTTKDTGMFIYNMNSTKQPIGLYYWTGSTWVLVTTNSGVVSSMPIPPAVNNISMTSGYYYVFAYNPSSYGGNGSASYGGGNLDDGYWQSPNESVITDYSSSTLANLLSNIQNTFAVNNAGFLATSNGTFSKVYGWLEPSVTGKVNIYVYKFTPSAGNATTAYLGSSTLFGSYLPGANLTGGNISSFEIDGTASNTFNKGDVILLIYEVSTGMYITMNASIEVEYQ